jgi:hypothetical protein
MEITPPDCCTEPRTPCSEKDWVQCACCARYVCLVHDELFVVLYSGLNPTGADRVCADCIEFLFETGEISKGAEYQYVILR